MKWSMSSGIAYRPFVKSRASPRSPDAARFEKHYVNPVAQQLYGNCNTRRPRADNAHIAVDSLLVRNLASINDHDTAAGGIGSCKQCGHGNGDQAL